jgi:hypothetical protein
VAYASNGTNILLNHVLHHIWSSVVLDSRELNENTALLNLPANLTTYSSSSSFIVSSERENMPNYCCLFYRWKRDLFNNVPEVHKIQLSKTNNVQL